MPDRYLTLSEAESFTGKSRSTLRRFLDAIVKAADSPDRRFLLPTPEEVAALKEQSQPFSWRIHEELLRRQFLQSDPADAHAPGDSGSGGVGADTSELVAVLRDTFATLKSELEQKNLQLAQANERLRESNILMKDLQQRIALPPAKSSDAATVQGQVMQSPIVAEEPPKPKRRGLWPFRR